MSKRRSIRDKVKSLKINYLQGANSCGFGFCKRHKKGRNFRVPPTIEKNFIDCCLLYNQLVCVY